uniref:Uncharacterized protein n=1 Tax=Amphimedon queenslandica TaxID=400682 RepID=A0A1X7UMI1_AMPQE
MDTGIPVNSMYAYATAEPPYDQPGFDKQFEATKEVPSTEGASDHDDMQKEEDLESDEKIQEPPPIQKGPLFSLTQLAKGLSQEKLKELLRSSVIDQIRTSNTGGAALLLKEL